MRKVVVRDFDSDSLDEKLKVWYSTMATCWEQRWLPSASSTILHDEGKVDNEIESRLNPPGGAVILGLWLSHEVPKSPCPLW
jgi:hypothetical protein